MTESRQLWWLNPAWVAGLMGLIVSVGAYAIPEPLYRTFWRTPKFFDGYFLSLSLGMTALFVLGAMAAAGSGRSAARGNWKDDLPWPLVTRWFWMCFYGSLAGYVIWAGVAVA